MKTVRLVTGLAAVAAVLAAFVMQHRQHHELRRELALLRGELKLLAAQPKPAGTGDAAPLAIVERQENERGELAKLREDISNLRVGTQELLKIAQTSAPPPREQPASAAPADGNLIPVHGLKNAGRATPDTAAETLLWAAVGGEVDTLAAGLVFTPSARAKADAWFAGLTESTRAEYGTPEKVIALMIAREADKLGGIQILGQRELTPGLTGVRLRFADAQGNTKDDNFVMQRGADGWRLVLPDATVEKFGRQLAGRK